MADVSSAWSPASLWAEQSYALFEQSSIGAEVSLGAEGSCLTCSRAAASICPASAHSALHHVTSGPMRHWLLLAARGQTGSRGVKQQSIVGLVLLFCTVRFQMVSDESLKKETAQPEKQSHYVGDGPDFQRSLFNLGGQSPLVVYYLKMHGISNTLENSRLYKITHTEICKEPTPDSPTYQDVIEESKKFTKKLHDDFLDFEHRCIEELTEIEEQREKVNRKFQRLLVKLSKNPNELRLRTQALIQKLENPSPGQTTSTAVNSMVKKTQY